MPFTDNNSQLEPLLFQMKQFKNLTKTAVDILPSSGQTEYGPNRRCIFTLPYASLISLEDLAFHFTFEPDVPQFTSSATGLKAPYFRVLPPKDVASLIAEIDIKINGQTIQHLTRYNDIVNILNTLEHPETAKHVLQGVDPSVVYEKNTAGTWKDLDTVDYDLTPQPHNFNNRPKKYVINHWYGLLGHRGKDVSSNFIDTNILGEVTIAFVFDTPSVCIKGTGVPTVAHIQTVAATSGTDAPTATQITNAALQGSYKISGCKMSMVRYNLPMSYSEAVRSALVGGQQYKIAFNHYETHSQAASAQSDSIRWNENSRDIKALVAYFHNSDRDTNVPSPYNAIINSSSYFVYGNPIHDKSQFQIGSTMMPQNKLDNTDLFLELIRGVPGTRGQNARLNIRSHDHTNKGETLEVWLQGYFMAYLSLEMTEGMTQLANDGKKLLSGLSSEQLPISCVYTYDNDTSFHNSTPATGVTKYPWNKTLNVMSITTRMLVIENGQHCSVEI
jgi:hypothetical protein